jgi:DNA-binding transcriptional LysR family regulator
MFTGSLRAFDETARLGSIRKASEALGVAPSSVSRHIVLLEREIGTPLFHRRARGVELTNAGELVAEYTRVVLAEYDTLRTDLDDVRGSQRRHIQVAMVESIAHSGPVNAIVRFLADYPTITFDLRLMPAPAVTNLVRQGLCDIGISYCSKPAPDIKCLRQIDEPIVACMQAEHPMAQKAQIELTELAEYSLALPDHEFGVRKIIDEEAARHGIMLKPTLTSNVFRTLRDYAVLGSAIAILPASAARTHEYDRLVSVPIKGDAFQHATVDIIVYSKRRLPRVVATFANVVIESLSSPKHT